jgi:hypothetical protein
VVFEIDTIKRLKQNRKVAKKLGVPFDKLRASLGDFALENCHNHKNIRIRKICRVDESKTFAAAIH